MENTDIDSLIAGRAKADVLEIGDKNKPHLKGYQLWFAEHRVGMMTHIQRLDFAQDQIQMAADSSVKFSVNDLTFLFCLMDDIEQEAEENRVTLSVIRKE